MKVEEREVAVALTSERRRATHSGTGDGSGKELAMKDNNKNSKGVGDRSVLGVKSRGVVSHVLPLSCELFRILQNTLLIIPLNELFLSGIHGRRGKGRY